MAIPKSSLKKRGKVFYLHFFENGVRKRISLRTDSFETAKEQQRQFDSSRARGEGNSFPTRTPLADAVAAYVTHMRVSRTRHGYTADISYLRNAFGPICEALEPKRHCARMLDDDVDMRCRDSAIEAVYVEQITTAQISDFIRDHVQRYGIQAKTANRYREVLRRFFSWSMQEGGVRMPGDLNPAAKVKRQKEPAPQIHFLTLEQIDQQLHVLLEYPVIHAMVATYIYAGLRREEAIWLTVADVDLNVGRFGAIRVQAKTVSGESWQPKTKVNRVVPISPSSAVVSRVLVQTAFPALVSGGVSPAAVLRGAVVEKTPLRDRGKGAIIVVSLRGRHDVLATESAEVQGGIVRLLDAGGVGTDFARTASATCGDRRKGAGAQ